MKRFFYLFLLMIIVQNTTLAQFPAADNSSCPAFAIETSNRFALNEVELLYKVVFLKDFDSSKLKYHWTISNGKILSGQGTKSIVIKGVNESTATVQLHGLPSICLDTASASVSLDPPPVVMADEYSKIGVEAEKERLNVFGKALENDPTAIGFITKSFARNRSKINVYRDLNRISKYLESLGISRERIIFGAAYDKAEKTTLFIVPAGTQRPEFDDEILDAAKLAEKLKTVKAKSRKKRIKRNSATNYTNEHE